MTDILSTFLSSNSTLKRNRFQNKFISESNKIFLDNGLRLSKEGNILKIPKLNNDLRIITEKKNEYFEDLYLNANKDNEIIIINNSEIEDNNIFKNEYLIDLNNQNNKHEKYNKYNKKIGKIKNERNKNNKSNSINKYIISENHDKNEMEKEKEKERKKLVERYIDALMRKGKEKSDKFYEATKKVESNKFSLENSINPKKYIQKKILDDSFNCNDFKTAKIQEDCFNGNQKFREANYKNIKINMMNNVFLNSMNAEPEENDTKFLLDKMIAEQNHLNNFNFGKQIFNRREEETLGINNNIVF